MNQHFRAALALGLLAVLSSDSHAVLLTANFDELTEGYSAAELVSGGIRFFAIDQNLGGGDNFTIEQANSGNLGAWFSPPNVLGFGGYVPGEGVAFGRLRSFKMEAPGYFMNSVSLDFWTLLFQPYGNTVTLEGWLGNVLVNSVTQTPGIYTIYHLTLSLPAEKYDQLRIECRGPYDNGVLFADVDNVLIQAEPVPEPGTLLAVGLGMAVLLGRRRPQVK